MHDNQHFNDPVPSYHQQFILQHSGPVYFECSITNVDYNYVYTAGREPATLITFRTRFEPKKGGRRISYAEMTFTFSSQNGPQPEVLFFGPEHKSLRPTARIESVITGVDVNIGGQFGVELGGGYKYEKQFQKEKEDHAILGGHSVVEDGKRHGVTWFTRENESEKTGVPNEIQTYIILQGCRGDTFQCNAEFKVKFDWITTLEDIFSARTKINPVIFNPAVPFTSQPIDPDLDSLVNITFY